MNIYLLRHGIAEEPSANVPESERELTAKGRRKMRKIARAMGALNLHFDRVLSSPLVRAVQTAEVICRELDDSMAVSLCPALAPGVSKAGILKVLRDLPAETEDVLLTGHEPDLGILVSELVYGRPGAGIRFKKGGLAKVTLPGLDGQARGSLEWLLTARQMLLMAGDTD